MSTSQSKNVAAGPKSKFQPVNINSVYSGKSALPAKPAGATRHGLQSLGKQTAVKRRMPPPASLPSLRSESQGQDPDVALVPSGGQGWGTTDPPAQSTLNTQSNQDTSNTSFTNHADHKVAAPVVPRVTRPELCPPWAIKDKPVMSRPAPSQHQANGPSSREFPSLDAAGDGTKTAADLNGPSLRPQKSGAWKSGGTPAQPLPVRPSSVPGRGGALYEGSGGGGSASYYKQHVSTTRINAKQDGDGDPGKAPPPRYDGSFRTAQPVPPPPTATKVAPYYVMPPQPYRPPQAAANKNNTSISYEASEKSYQQHQQAPPSPPQAPPAQYQHDQPPPPSKSVDQYSSQGPQQQQSYSATGRRTLLNDDGDYHESYVNGGSSNQHQRGSSYSQSQQQQQRPSSGYETRESPLPPPPPPPQAQASSHQEHSQPQTRQVRNYPPVAQSTGVVWSEDEDDSHRTRSVPVQQQHGNETDSSSASPAYANGQSSKPPGSKRDSQDPAPQRPYAAYPPAMVPMYANGQGPPPEWFAAHPPPPMMMQQGRQPKYQSPSDQAPPPSVQQQPPASTRAPSNAPSNNYRTVPADYQTRDFEQEEAELKRNEDQENQERDAAINRARQRRKLGNQSSSEWDAEGTAVAAPPAANSTANSAAALNSYYFDVPDEPVQPSRNGPNGTASTGSNSNANSRQSSNRLPPRLQKQMDASGGDDYHTHSHYNNRADDRQRSNGMQRATDTRSSKRGSKTSGASKPQAPQHEQGEVRILQRPESKESAASYGAQSDRSSGKEGQHERLTSYREELSPEMEEDDELQMQPIAKPSQAPVKRTSGGIKDYKDTEYTSKPKYDSRRDERDDGGGYKQQTQAKSTQQQSRAKPTSNGDRGTKPERENAWGGAKRDKDEYRRDDRREYNRDERNDYSRDERKDYSRDERKDYGQRQQSRGHRNTDYNNKQERREVQHVQAVDPASVTEKTEPKEIELSSAASETAAEADTAQQPQVNVWQQRAEVRASQERDRDDSEPFPLQGEQKADYNSTPSAADRRSASNYNDRNAAQQFHGREFYNSRRGSSTGRGAPSNAPYGRHTQGTRGTYTNTRGGGSQRGRSAQSGPGGSHRTSSNTLNMKERADDRSKLKRKADSNDDPEMDVVSAEFAALEVKDHTPRRQKETNNQEEAEPVEGEAVVADEESKPTHPTSRRGARAAVHGTNSGGRGRGNYHNNYQNGDEREYNGAGYRDNRRYNQSNADYSNQANYRNNERSYREYNNEPNASSRGGRGGYKTQRPYEAGDKSERYGTGEMRRGGRGFRMSGRGAGRGVSSRDQHSERHSTQHTGHTNTNYKEHSNEDNNNTQQQPQPHQRHVKSPPTSDGLEEWETASESSNVDERLNGNEANATEQGEDKEDKGNKRQGVSFSANRHINTQTNGHNGRSNKSAERSVSKPTGSSNNQTMTGSKNVKAASRQGTHNKINSRNTAAPGSSIGKPDALAGFDINNYAGVVVIDDQPDIMGAQSMSNEAMDGFQQVVSKKEKRAIKERKEQLALLELQKAKKAAAAAEGCSRRKIARNAANSNARNKEVGTAHEKTAKDTRKDRQQATTGVTAETTSVTDVDVNGTGQVGDPMHNISTWQPQLDGASDKDQQTADAFNSVEHFEAESTVDGGGLWSGANAATKDIQPVGFARHLAKQNKDKKSDVVGEGKKKPSTATVSPQTQSVEAPKSDTFDFTFDAGLAVITSTTPVQLSAAALDHVVAKLSPNRAQVDSPVVMAALSPKQQQQQMTISSSDNELSEKLNAVRAVWENSDNCSNGNTSAPGSAGLMQGHNQVLAVQPTIPFGVNGAGNDVENMMSQQQHQHHVAVSVSSGPQIATVRPQPQLPVHLSASNTPTPPAPASALCIDPGLMGAQSLFGAGAAFGLANDLSNMSIHQPPPVSAQQQLVHQQHYQQQQQLFAQQQYQQQAFDAAAVFGQTAGGLGLASPPVLTSSQYSQQQLMQAPMMNAQVMHAPLVNRHLDNSGMLPAAAYSFNHAQQQQHAAAMSPWLSTTTTNATTLNNAATPNNNTATGLLTVTNGPPPSVHHNAPPPMQHQQQPQQPGSMLHDMHNVFAQLGNAGNNSQAKMMQQQGMFMRAQGVHAVSNAAQQQHGGLSMSMPPPPVIGPNHYAPLMHQQQQQMHHQQQQQQVNAHQSISSPPPNAALPPAPQQHNMSAPPPPVHVGQQQPQVNLSQPPPPLFGAVGSQRAPGAFKQQPFGGPFSANAPPPHMNMNQQSQMMMSANAAFDRTAGLLGKAPPSKPANSVFMPPHNNRVLSPPLGQKMYPGNQKSAGFPQGPPPQGPPPYMGSLPTGPVHPTSNTRSPVVPIQRPRKRVDMQPNVTGGSMKHSADGGTSDVGVVNEGVGVGKGHSATVLDASTSLDGDLLQHIDQFISKEQTNEQSEQQAV